MTVSLGGESSCDPVSEEYEDEDEEYIDEYEDEDEEYINEYEDEDEEYIYWLSSSWSSWFVLLHFVIFLQFEKVLLWF